MLQTANSRDFLGLSWVWGVSDFFDLMLHMRLRNNYTIAVNKFRIFSNYRESISLILLTCIIAKQMKPLLYNSELWEGIQISSTLSIQ